MKAAIIVSLVAALTVAVVVAFFCLNPKSTKFAHNQNEETEKAELVEESYTDVNSEDSEMNKLSGDSALDEGSDSEQTIDKPKMLEASDNLFWEDIAMVSKQFELETYEVL